MEKHLSEKRKQIQSVEELLKTAKLSSEKYDSTIEPFYMKQDNDDYIMNYKDLPKIPESLNRHIKIFYTCLNILHVFICFTKFCYIFLYFPYFHICLHNFT